MSNKQSKRKRPLSAYMLWLADAREQIIADNPDLTAMEITKKVGEMWRGLEHKTDSVQVWEEKAAKDKEEYVKYLKNKLHI